MRRTTTLRFEVSGAYREQLEREIAVYLSNFTTREPTWIDVEVTSAAPGWRAEVTASWEEDDAGTEG